VKGQNINTDILINQTLKREDLIFLLNSKGDEYIKLLKTASEVKNKYVGKKVYLRGLIEFSNICLKNCYYCGIRNLNHQVQRYNLTDEEIINAANFAHQHNYGSIVLQSGEISSKTFSERIENLLKKIKKLSDNKLGITLSCGEQSEDTYKRWFDAGASRYLLRIETSNRDLYYKIHPSDLLHSFEKRMESLHLLKKCGFQLGTGVMIGLPFQTIENLADDLMFMKNIDIDMCGMGPYLVHQDTPLARYCDELFPVNERFELTLKMIALLRIIMPDINIASATALQAIDKIGREKAIQVGANILMPNITPGKYRDNYKLYENKPCTDENADDCKNCIEIRVKLAGGEIAYGEWGDSLHFKQKKKI
jgi:biotin synthase